MTRSGSLIRNVLTNWLVIAANVVFALTMTPVIVRTLDSERYGVWSFLSGLVGYSELLYLGLGSAIVKFVAERRAKGDQAGISRLASVAISIYGVIGTACLAAFVAASPFVPRAFAEPLSPAAAESTTLVCALLGFRLLTVFVASAFGGVSLGHDRFDAVNSVYLASVVIKFAALRLVLQYSDPLLSLALLVAALGIFEVVALGWIAMRLFPDLRVRPTIPRLSELKILYGFGLQSFFILLAVKLISYTDTTVIGLMLGASSVAMYSLPLQLVEYARLTVGGFAGVFLPRVTVLFNQGDADGLRQAFLRSARIGSFLVGWLGGLLITLGPPFLSLWIGSEYGHAAQWVLVYLSLALFAQVLTSQVPLPFYQGLHLLKVPGMVIMAEGVLNLCLSLALARKFGITGVAVATAIPAAVSLFILPLYLCRKLGLPVALLFRQAVVPGVAMLVSVVILQVVTDTRVPRDSYLGLLIASLITLPLALVLIWWTFPTEDRRLIRHLLRFNRASTGTA